MSASNDPLWEKILVVIGQADSTTGCAAAVLRVIADEVVPESTEPPWPADQSDWAWHDCKQDIRQLLLAEAARAEEER